MISYSLSLTLSLQKLILFCKAYLAITPSINLWTDSDSYPSLITAAQFLTFSNVTFSK